jgi:hypothetical protein
MEDEKRVSKVSQSKLDANRSNTRRSTGPTSEAGKARAAQNSYKHGFFALRLFPTPKQRAKDGDDYNQIFRGLFEHYSPQGYMEHFWLEKAATEALRLARLFGWEQEAFGPMSGFLDRTLDKLMRYETSVTRHFTQAIGELERLQRMRNAESHDDENSNSNPDNSTSESEMPGDEPLPKTNATVEESAQASAPSKTLTPNPLVSHVSAESSFERLELIHTDPWLTKSLETNPPGNSPGIEYADDDDLPTDDPDYDAYEDNPNPRLTAEDVLDEKDRRPR